MNDKKQNLQDTFLNNVRKNKTQLTVFLVNGVKLNGVLTWFDNFSILLRRDGQSQLIYKHAVSTIMPNETIEIMHGETQIAETQTKDEPNNQKEDENKKEGKNEDSKMADGNDGRK